MPNQNRWARGQLYYPKGPPPFTFFTQPGGPFTPVFPTQQNATPWTDYPIPGLVIQEYSPWWAPGCGHSIKEWLIIREWDYDTNKSVALVCCKVCSYIQNTIEPFEEWMNPIERAIIVS